jgi:hypothetical protein
MDIPDPILYIHNGDGPLKVAAVLSSRTDTAQSLYLHTKFIQLLQIPAALTTQFLL